MEPAQIAMDNIRKMWPFVRFDRAKMRFIWRWEEAMDIEAALWSAEQHGY